MTFPRVIVAVGLVLALLPFALAAPVRSSSQFYATPSATPLAGNASDCALHGIPGVNGTVVGIACFPVLAGETHLHVALQDYTTLPPGAAWEALDVHGAALGSASVFCGAFIERDIPAGTATIVVRVLPPQMGCL